MTTNTPAGEELELLPCCCKSDARALSVKANMDHGDFACRERGRYVYCSNCWAHGPTFNSDAEAKAGWNRSRAVVAAPQGDAYTAYNQAIEDAKTAIREAPSYHDDDNYCAASYINAIARKCSPHVYVNRLAAAPVAPVPPDWRWYDNKLRAQGDTDLANRLLAEFKPDQFPAATSTTVDGEQPRHHKHCSIWTVTSGGTPNPCDCVCQCGHTMFEHIRPGEHYWYEDCAVDGCACMKFTATTPTAVTSEGGEQNNLLRIIKTAIDTCDDVTGIGYFAKDVDPVGWVRDLQNDLEQGVKENGSRVAAPSTPELIKQAAEEIIEMDLNGRYDPHDPNSRQAIVSILSRYFGAKQET